MVKTYQFTTECQSDGVTASFTISLIFAVSLQKFNFKIQMSNFTSTGFQQSSGKDYVGSFFLYFGTVHCYAKLAKAL